METGHRAGQHILPRPWTERSALLSAGMRGRRRKGHLGTHHIVSFIKNHNRPLEVNAVGSATLQQEGRDARLGPKGSRPAGDAPSGHARLDLPTH